LRARDFLVNPPSGLNRTANQSKSFNREPLEIREKGKVRKLVKFASKFRLVFAPLAGEGKLIQEASPEF
jgi:hypothetical protein